MAWLSRGQRRDRRGPLPGRDHPQARPGSPRAEVRDQPGAALRPATRRPRPDPLARRSAHGAGDRPLQRPRRRTLACLSAAGDTHGRAAARYAAVAPARSERPAWRRPDGLGAAGLAPETAGRRRHDGTDARPADGRPRLPGRVVRERRAEGRAGRLGRRRRNPRPARRRNQPRLLLPESWRAAGAAFRSWRHGPAGRGAGRGGPRARGDDSHRHSRGSCPGRGRPGAGSRRRRAGQRRGHPRRRRPLQR